MEVSFSEIIREAKNAVNARFDIIENIMNSSKGSSDLYKIIYEQNNEINNMKAMFNTIMARLDLLENSKPIATSPSEKMPELMIKMIEETPKPILTGRSHNEDDDEDEYTKKLCIDESNKNVDVEMEEESTNEYDADIEEHEEEEEEEEAEEEEAEEEEAELEEFEYKGITLYRDSESKVYRLDEDGALSDPIGVWDEAKQKIKKIV